MHDQPDKFAKSSAWILSVTIHLAIASLLLGLAGAGGFASRSADCTGDEAETVIAHVGLLTAEQEAALFRASSPPADPAPDITPPPVAQLEARPAPPPTTPTHDPAPIQALAASAPSAASAVSPPAPIKLESQPLALPASAVPQLAHTPSPRPTLAFPLPAAPAHSIAPAAAASASASVTPGSPAEALASSVGGPEIGAAVRKLPRPNYPPASKRANEQGIVVLEIEVHADGSLGAVHVVEDPGHARLVTAAMDALRDAAFEPAQRGGKPVDSVLRIPFRFVIRS